MQNPPTAESKPPTPPIWIWYVLLCLANAALNGAMVYLGYWMLGNDAYFVQNWQTPPGSLRESAVLLIASGALVAAGNVILPFLPKRPWAWVLHLTNIIAAGLTCLLAPLAVPLAIGWFRPAAKDYFDFR